MTLAQYSIDLAAQPEPAVTAIERAAGDEVIMKRLENPTGNTAEHARVQADLARRLREADASQGRSELAVWSKVESEWGKP